MSLYSDWILFYKICLGIVEIVQCLIHRVARAKVAGPTVTIKVVSLATSPAADLGPPANSCGVVIAGISMTETTRKGRRASR